MPFLSYNITPQEAVRNAGCRGRDEESAQRILDDAKAVADAGAYALVLEGIPAELATRITAAIDIPTTGIGAGIGCDGQVLVCYDMLGLTPDLRPKFVRRFDELFERGKAAMEQYASAVRSGEFPAPEHAFGPAKGPRAVASGS